MDGMPLNGKHILIQLSQSAQLNIEVLPPLRLWPSLQRSDVIAHNLDVCLHLLRSV